MSRVGQVHVMVIPGAPPERMHDIEAVYLVVAPTAKGYNALLLSVSGLSEDGLVGNLVFVNEPWFLTVTRLA